MNSEIGYFFVPKLETSFRVRGSGSKNYKYHQINPSIKYYLPLGKRSAFYPSVALTTSIEKDAQTTYFLGGGFNHFLNRNIALDLQYNYEFANNDIFDNSLNNFNIGLKYFLK
jgi:hypothetical protein